VEETIRNTGNKHQILLNYLRPFDEGRQIDACLKDMSLNPTLEFINFHKSFQDVAGFDELDEWKQYGP
jgi:hypothetical protein